MRAEETKCFDILSDDKLIRYGVVFDGSNLENRWVAIFMTDDTWQLVGFYASPNDAINAVMKHENPELMSKEDRKRFHGA